MLLESTDLTFPIVSPPTTEASLRIGAEARPSTAPLALPAPASATAAIPLFLTPVTGVASVTAAVSPTSNHVLFLSRISRYRAMNRAIPISVLAVSWVVVIVSASPEPSSVIDLARTRDEQLASGGRDGPASSRRPCARSDRPITRRYLLVSAATGNRVAGALSREQT